MALDFGAEGAEAFLDSTEPAIDLADIADLRFALGTKSGDEQGHAGSDIRAGQFGAPEFV